MSNIIDVLLIILSFAVLSALGGFGISFLLFKRIKNFTLFDYLATSFIIGLIPYVLLVFMEVSFGIQISQFAKIINLALIAVLNIAIIWRFRVDILSRKLLDRSNYIILSMLVLVSFVRVFPFLTLNVPMLHDPIPHATWLKELAITGFPNKNSWYPQGLQYFLVHFDTLGAKLWAKNIFIYTSIALSLLPLSFYYFFRLTNSEKNKDYLAIISFIITSSLIYPAMLVVTAGKNSLLMVFSIIPVALYFMLKDEKGYPEEIFFALMLAAIFVIHFPTGVLMYLMTGLIYLYRIVEGAYKKRNINEYLKRILVIVGVTLPLLAISFFYTYPIYKAMPPENDKSVAGLIAGVESGGKLNYLMNDFYQTEVSLFGRFGMIIVLLSIVAIGIYLSRKENYKEKYLLKLMLAFICTYVAFASVLFINKTYGIFLNMEIRFFYFFILAIFLSWFAGYLLKEFNSKIFKYMAWSLLIVILLASNYLLFKKFVYSKSVYNIVTSQDMEAFEEIKKIEDNKKILVQMNFANGVTYSSDGGSWLEYYTGKNIEVNFMNFAKPEAMDIYNHYSNLKKGNQRDYRDLYCDYGIGYIYWGNRQVFGSAIVKSDLTNSNYLDNIFDMGASSPALYKIRAINCSK